MKALLLAAVALPIAAHAKICAPPAPASAAGYNTQTYGGMKLGSNIFAYNRNPASAGLVQNADGSITLKGSSNWHYNDQLNTGNQGFGGGAFIEATLAIKNPIVGWNQSGRGWPAFWANGQLTPNPVTVETDFFEFMDAGSNNFATGMHTWGRNGEITNSAKRGINALAVVPPGTDLSQRHTYGWLWVPATANSRGYTKMYFDGQQVGPTYSWNQGSGAFNQLDAQNLKVMLGTSAANPMTVYDLQVWQASAARDIGLNLSSVNGICSRASVSR
jgi:hypothetical protein